MIANNNNKVLFLIDNGHGCNTCGKCSPCGREYGVLYEWSYCRKLASSIVHKLIGLGYNSELVTPEDNDISLSERANRVNKRISEVSKYGTKVVLVSVHLNAASNGHDWKNATGWEIWTTESKNNSDKLAKVFENTFNELLPNKKFRGCKEKNFTLLYKVNCPAVLTENFFMDSISDYDFLESDYGFNKIVDLHVSSLVHYIGNVL